MATQYAFGQIVTSGLVLSLDAADKNSYSGSGTTWSDLSGNNLNATLNNSPTFSTANGGTLTFNGTNTYCNIPDNTLLRPSSLTVSVWAKKNSTTQVQSIIFTKRYDAITSPFNSYNIAQSSGTNQPYLLLVGTAAIQDGVTTPNIADTLWHQIVMTYGSNTVTGYVDGVNVGTKGVTGPIIYANLDFTIAGSATWGGTNAFNGNISGILLYNRVLSSTEILQNYNAQKSRFGL